ncbi:hypothetical protein [Rubrivivax gelatinosus]|uniref:hypothetical protein n=1 Tax=Rubrivivax gelatinosus TaxID=28068 RepID=UPI0005C26105|nr:hypothetical protein [Rubrivivax gelatinosus]MBG6082982.1 hypothetical protein [Rubrivivax gelatinosus]
MAIYAALLRGESARSVASRWNISHPTALKYAQDGIEHLKSLPAVANDGQITAFLQLPIKMQLFSVAPEVLRRLLEIIEPIVEVADELLAQLASPGEPTTTISARVPESLFYQFRRLASEIEKKRGQPVTISSLLTEVMRAYVETGKVPVAEASFLQSDLIMDDIRAVLAKHGVAPP